MEIECVYHKTPEEVIEEQKRLSRRGKKTMLILSLVATAASILILAYFGWQTALVWGAALFLGTHYGWASANAYAAQKAIQETELERQRERSGP